MGVLGERLFAGLGQVVTLLLTLDLFFDVFHLHACAHHIRVLIGVSQQQAVQLVLQIDQLGPVHAFAGLHRGHFGFS